MHSTHIRFLKNNQVNKQRWDDCIDHCPNGLIYAKSFYLDCVCPGWNALVSRSAVKLKVLTENASIKTHLLSSLVSPSASSTIHQNAGLDVRKNSNFSRHNVTKKLCLH